MEKKMENRNREGQRVPSVTFKLRADNEWQDVSSTELFAGKKVVMFALPGAFTPTCSATHLPGYEANAERLRAAGADEILCISVNDAFVMDAWGQDQGASRVRLLADGNGDFSRGMGMLVDKSDLGFGERSWRYSMVVDDGLIEKMFIEPAVNGDPFEVSDAQTMLAYLAPEQMHAPEVTLFTQPGCGYCDRARTLLDERGWDYEEIVVGTDVSREAMRGIVQASSTPQAFIDGKHIGGSDDLALHLAA